MNKKIVALFLAFCTAASFCSCGQAKGNEARKNETVESASVSNQTEAEQSTADSREETNYVSQFNAHIESGDYAKAIQVYSTHIKGNAMDEASAAEYLEAYGTSISTDLLTDTITQAEATAKRSVFTNVYKNTGCNVVYYDNICEDIQNALNSKIAYASGIKFFENEKYIEAITELKKVSPVDNNYISATEKADEALRLYKSDINTQAESFVSENDYLNAINLLKDAVTLLPDDTELISSLTVCESDYINYTVDSAKTAFTEPNEYQPALDIIQSGLQNYPENEKLLTEQEYYSSFIPVSVYDMSKLRGKASTYSSDKDIYGNSYERCFWAGYSSMVWFETDISYHLAKEYNVFSATVFCRSKSNSAQKMEVVIYGDGNIIYQKSDIMDNGTEPFAIELNVTGVSELRIVITRIGGVFGPGIGMTDMYLQRTQM